MFEQLKFLLLRVMPNNLRKRRILNYFESGAGEQELAVLGQFVKAGDRCLDIGCNMGAYSHALSNLGAKVTAFEPNPVMVDIVRGLALPGVEVQQIALSNVDGQATLNVPLVSSGHALASLRDDPADNVQTQKITVDTRRLDSLELTGLKFVKIDVEGFEEQVLEGAQATITRERPTLLIEIEERHNSGGLARIVERLAALGYTAHYLRGGIWQDFATFNLNEDQNGADASRPYINNFLFLPPTDARAE